MLCPQCPITFSGARPDTGSQILRQDAAVARRLSFWIRAYIRLLPFLSIIFVNAPVSSKEAVIFEQIGQLAGVTAYLHVHIELSITSVEQQLDKYRQLLVTKLGTEESIATLGQAASTPSRRHPLGPMIQSLEEVTSPPVPPGPSGPMPCCGRGLPSFTFAT